MCVHVRFLNYRHVLVAVAVDKLTKHYCVVVEGRTEVLLSSTLNNSASTSPFAKTINGFKKEQVQRMAYRQKKGLPQLCNNALLAYQQQQQQAHVYS